jgi:hypothetical protein
MMASRGVIGVTALGSKLNILNEEIDFQHSTNFKLLSLV